MNNRNQLTSMTTTDLLFGCVQLGIAIGLLCGSFMLVFMLFMMLTDTILNMYF